MLRKLFSITTILLFAVSATAFAQLNIGYMNTQEVLNQLPERERVQNELESFIQEKQEQLSERATKYEDAVAEYQQNRSAMSEQQIQAREKELTETQNSLDQFNQKIRQEIQQKREELLAPIFSDIDKAISAIAENEGLDFVINQATNSGNRILFYASDNQIDITQRVIDRIKTTSEN